MSRHATVGLYDLTMRHVTRRVLRNRQYEVARAELSSFVKDYQDRLPADQAVAARYILGIIRTAERSWSMACAEFAVAQRVPGCDGDMWHILGHEQQVASMSYRQIEVVRQELLTAWRRGGSARRQGALASLLGRTFAAEGDAAAADLWYGRAASLLKGRDTLTTALALANEIRWECI